MNNTDTYNVTAHDLWTYLNEIQKAVQAGYVLSDKNENFPQAFISLYTCTLVKPEVVAKPTANVSEVTTPEVSPEVTIADMASNAMKSAGRPAKVKK